MQLNAWYHVTLRVVGCSIVATAQRTTSWDQVRVGVSDAGCAPTGAAGVRTMIPAADFREFGVSEG